MIELQRVYEHHGTHGTRFLVERLWPRGIRKESLHFSDWLKDVAQRFAAPVVPARGPQVGGVPTPLPEGAR